MIGASQLTRAIPALRAETAPLDSRTSRQLIAQVVERATLYRFFDTQNRATGDWRTAYEQVPLIRYARLAEWKLGPEREWSTEALRSLAEANSYEPGMAEVGARLVAQLQKGFFRVEEERVAFSAWPHERRFVEGLEDLIVAHLAEAWHRLRACREEIRRQWPRSEPAEAFEMTRDWPKLEPRFWGEGGSESSWGAVRSRDALNRSLSAVSETLFSALDLVIAEAGRRFEETSAAPAELPPHVALYAAFIRQFVTAQGLLNELPRRHRDYYYREVLRAQPRGARPDHVFVAFSAAAPQTFALLPAGTKLSAGKDADGTPIDYRTDSPVPVNGRVGIVHADTLPISRSILAEGVDAAVAVAKLSILEGPRVHFRTSQRSHRALGPGFVFAHPVLALAEGRRVIRITVSLEALASENPVVNRSGELIFPGLCFDYTAPDGWRLIPPHRVTARFFPAVVGPELPSLDRLQWTLVLSPAMPALVPTETGLHGDQAWGAMPALRCRWFDPDSGIGSGVDPFDPASSGLPLLNRPVAGIEAKVVVAGVTSLAMSGPEGALSTEAPFTPFGATPIQGYAFDFAYPELLGKTVDALSLTFLWQNLPVNPVHFPKGLRSYFAAYLDAVNDPERARFARRDYRVTPQVGAGERWCEVETDHRQLLSGKGEGRLFDPDQTGTDALWSRTRWRFAPQPAVTELRRHGAGEVFASEPFSYRFRLQLDLPEEAFGQPLYAEVIETVANRNARVVTAELDDPAFPQRRNAGGWSLLEAFHSVTEPAPRSFWRRWWFRGVAVEDYPLVLDAEIFRRVDALRELTPGLTLRARELALDTKSFLDAFGQLKGVVFRGLSGLAKVFADRWGGKAGEAPEFETLVRWLVDLLAPLRLEQPQNLPLTPRVARATLAYSASAVWADSGSSAETHWWHWDGRNASRARPGKPLSARVEDDYLYLAFRGIEPGDTLRLLAVVESAPVTEGFSVSGPAEGETSTLWQCLVGDVWKTLPVPGRIRDGTEGFSRTGLITWEVSPKVDTDHTVALDGCVWLRVKSPILGRETEAVRWYLHGARATRVLEPSSVSAAFKAKALPPGTIRALRTPDPRIKSVHQPLDSFGGIEAEEDERFAVRVAEQLRHKGRAVTGWDFERLVLDRHPAVFFARAIPPARPAEAGRITLLVVPSRQANSAEVSPAFSKDELQRLWDDLIKRAAPDLRLTVSNPSYDRVRVLAQVAFVPDQTFHSYLERLSGELDTFIAPWIYDQSEPTALARLDGFPAAELGAFIRSRSYVKKLGSYALRVTPAQSEIESTDLREVAPSSPRTLLLPAARHEITPWTEA